MTKTKTRRVRSRMATRISRVSETDIHPNVILEVEVANGKIILAPAKSASRHYDRGALVKKILPRNPYREECFGRRQGREVW